MTNNIYSKKSELYCLTSSATKVDELSELKIFRSATCIDDFMNSILQLATRFHDSLNKHPKPKLKNYLEKSHYSNSGHNPVPGQFPAHHERLNFLYSVDIFLNIFFQCLHFFPEFAIHFTNHRFSQFSFNDTFKFCVSPNCHLRDLCNFGLNFNNLSLHLF